MSSILRMLIVSIICFYFTSSKAQPLWSLNEPLSGMTISTPDDALLKRKQLIQTIWGAPTPQLPYVVNTFPGNGNGGELAPAYFGRTPATSIWLSFTMENNVWARTYYATFTDSTCLMIINGGHGEGFFNYQNLTGFNIAGVDALVKQISAKPCDVILNSMPLQGENRFAASYVNINPDINTHDQLALLKPAVGSPLKYFFGPVLSTLNYALSQRSYDKIGAVGISGGGWETSMLAAIDPRIQRSYSVAGSVPLTYRAIAPEGDWEQYNVPIDYLDIYAMSVAETGHKSFLFYNSKDPCCFQTNAITPWAEPLTKAIANFPSKLGIYISYSSATHDIQPEMAKFIINDLTQ